MRRAQGFTLVEVLVALMVVALGLAALMITVSSTARSSGYLRDKTLAQWIALNRLSEVRLKLTNSGQNGDVGEVDYANRKWHYDTQYFDTSIATMKRVVVRVWAGDSKTKGSPLAESSTFLGSALNVPGSSNIDWTTGSTIETSTTPTHPTKPESGVTPNVPPSGVATPGVPAPGTTPIPTSVLPTQ